MLELKICAWNHYLFYYFGVLRRDSLYSPDCPGTHYVDQTGLTLRDQRALSLGLMVFATMPSRRVIYEAGSSRHHSLSSTMPWTVLWVKADTS